ncbi:MAG: phosphopyruvate hydratase [Candidatus Omnitrophica bacterium]|nr:phosphopyruvate hydratase [Candidatus Omnitrophota bacterium]MCM8793611.1 phosphopyruvate hydratase [Candidatus Omnitrophota bacterium]
MLNKIKLWLGLGFILSSLSSQPTRLTYAVEWGLRRVKEGFFKIEALTVHKAYDSRGKETIEAVVSLVNGIVGRAKVPAGASTGGNEAATVPVDVALKNAVAIGERLKKEGISVTAQNLIDDRMREYDGTSDLHNLGGNTIVGISLAIARAGALAKNLSLWKYLSQLAEIEPKLPLFYMNFLNGGKHSKANLEFQETIVIPDPRRKFTPDRWLQMGKDVFKKLGEILEEERTAGRVGYFDERAKFGDERGYAPIFSENIQFPEGITTRTEYTLYLLVKAIEKAGYKIGEDFALAWDVAANTLWERAAEKEKKKPEEYEGGYLFEGEIRSTEWMIDFYKKMVEKYKISSLEDPLSEWDWGPYGRNGWENLTKGIGDKVQLVLDDLTCTNLGLLTEAIKRGVGNAILIKTNQNGTLAGKPGTLAVIKLAKERGYRIVVSHRSGETEDDFIADLAVGVAADGLKTGGLGPQEPMNERLRKYLRVIEIWKEITRLP